MEQGNQMRKRSLLVVVAVVAGLMSQTGSVEGDTGGLDYVGMGDSYSAGSGISPSDPTASPLCLRSGRDLAHQFAALISPTSFNDVACGAAQTKDFTGSQYWGVGPQLDAVNADTDVITMTIGGNDDGLFIGTIAACASASALTWGFGSPCKSLYGNTFANKIDNIVYPNVRNALLATKAKAPNARIAIIGYLEQLPPGGCWGMGIAWGDVDYVRGIQDRLNNKIRQAAADAGVTFVDMKAVSTGHDSCKSASVRWVEPFLGNNPVPIHPNAAGIAAMAQQAKLALGL